MTATLESLLEGAVQSLTKKQNLGMFPAISPQPFDLKGGTGSMRRAQSRSNGRAACASSRSTWRREGGRSGGHHHQYPHYHRQVDIISIIIIIMDIFSVVSAPYICPLQLHHHQSQYCKGQISDTASVGSLRELSPRFVEPSVFPAGFPS